MALMDLLQSLIHPQGGDTSKLMQNSPTTDELSVTAAPRAQRASVQGLSTQDDSLNAGVTPSPVFNKGVSQDAPPPSMNYNNSQDVRAVNDSLTQPQGGSTNPGIYGLLPQGMQHGTLRNVLGALGDAFLVQAGDQPHYRQHMEQQAMGQAMAGVNMDDPASVSAGIQRLMATGSPGAMDMADKINQQFQQAQLRKATIDNTNVYREGVLSDRQQYHADETNARNLSTLRLNAQAMSGLVANAQTPEQYKAIHDRVEAMAQRLGLHASDVGLPDPEAWTPGSMNGYGATGAQVQTSFDRQRGQNLGVENNIRTNNAREGAARINASRPSEAGIDQNIIDNLDNGVPLSAGQQNWVDRHTSRNSRGGRSASGTPSVDTGTALGASLGSAAGNAFGGPPPAAVRMLRQNPRLRSAFEAKYGRGSSAKYLR